MVAFFLFLFLVFAGTYSAVTLLQMGMSYWQRRNYKPQHADERWIKDGWQPFGKGNWTR